jgi:hypothetical protein
MFIMNVFFCIALSPVQILGMLDNTTICLYIYILLFIIIIVYFYYILYNYTRLLLPLLAVNLEPITSTIHK